MKTNALAWHLKDRIIKDRIVDARSTSRQKATAGNSLSLVVRNLPSDSKDIEIRAWKSELNWQAEQDKKKS